MKKLFTPLENHYRKVMITNKKINYKDDGQVPCRSTFLTGFIIFTLAFFLNWIWENLHSYLYIHYQNGPITQLILLQASLIDAIFITIMGWFFIRITFFRKKLWLAFIIGVAAAVFLELYALKTGRWDYNELMPIIPLLNTGLTPTIQLGFLAWFVYKLVLIKKTRQN